MTPAPALRRATSVDAERLSALSTALFLHTYAPTHERARLERYAARALSVDAWRATLADGSTTWLLLAGEDAVAYVLVGAAPLPPGSLVRGTNAHEVRRLYVRADRHREGLGRRLLDAARATAREGHGDVLWLSMYAQNHAARAFYEREGLAVVGTTPFELDGLLEQDLVLACPL